MAYRLYGNGDLLAAAAIPSKSGKKKSCIYNQSRSVPNDVSIIAQGEEGGLNRKQKQICAVHPVRWWISKRIYRSPNQ